MSFSRIALGAVTALSLAAALGACGKKEDKTTTQVESGVPVLLATARTAPESQDVVAYGQLRSDKEAALSFKIGGLIKTLKADTGDRVTKGQLLAELDQREINAEASRAAYAVEKARRDLARIEPLLAKGFVSQQKVQDAKSAYDMAVADRQRVEFDRSLASIVAPADGIVLTRHADINEIIAPGAPVLTVSQGSEGYILKAGLSDRDVARLAIGDHAEVTLDAFPQKPVSGTIRRLSAMSDAHTGTFEVEIALEGVPSGAESGFMGEARIAPAPKAGSDKTEQHLAIPASAILEGHGSTATIYVFDPAKSTVRLARVSVGTISGEEVVITDGLSAGAQVVSAGAPYLRDGVKVKVVTDLAAEQPVARPRT
ncbi:efflux RND transporter periplasmic adaptor subunit [Parvibaculum sedimenti]|uniref:Efflux RND transporter periplasmic adaptor subunit n=1 Tax=Parvibaculum sedimenti TaxID=2608632 RepID=A0A6N6VN64_9HYPH|nr:efflux RND transporter periplasmic adaptor subunit [Parvibaculum sedimenti]KAB7742092.1 efflux RND transporter periplasmic adaptor subunit [Parvibaculum sedimenti]